MNKVLEKPAQAGAAQGSSTPALAEFLRRWDAGGWPYYSTISDRALQGQLGEAVQVGALVRAAELRALPLGLRRLALAALKEIYRADERAIPWQRLHELGTNIEQAAFAERLIREPQREAERRRRATAHG